MCTNGKWIRFHPAFVSELTVEELKFVLGHEVGHMVFQHMFRRGKRNPVIWNFAGDYIINDMLTKEGIGAMPAGKHAGLLDANKVQAGGGTTEGVYDVIYQELDSQGWIKKLGVGDQWDNCQDPGGTQAEKQQAEAEMKIAVAQAAAAAKMCGKLGESLERFVNQALKPKVDWKAVLRRFVSTKAKNERSYSRPKRRFIADDMYLPGLSGDQLGEMVVAVDCSGSISQKEIEEFAAELRAIHEDLKPSKMHVIYWHSDVSRHDIFEVYDELVIKPNGTGGTEFAPVLDYIVKNGIEPTCCVVLTDLCIGTFGDDPGYPVLWCSTYKGTAPWGDVICMADKL
jgi:predicted metal-dependent peptidase